MRSFIAHGWGALLVWSRALRWHTLHKMRPRCKSRGFYCILLAQFSHCAHAEPMRLFMVFLSIVTILITPLLSAQTDPQQRLTKAFDTERDAHPEKTIAILQPLLLSGTLDPATAGKAWDVLALAYQDEGSTDAARHASEQAIHLLKSLPANKKDYAMALDNFGRLYLNLEQFDQANRLRTQALHIDEQIDDHEGISTICSNLAGISFAQNRVREGRKYLERAKKEAAMSSLGEDDLASISSMEGWLAEYDGKFSASIEAFQRSLDLWRGSHGEAHPSTGWGYMLLGNAHAASGDTAEALTEMQQGLAILGHALGQQSPRYLTAEIAYANVLDQSGSHTEAAALRANASQSLQNYLGSQCANCTISAKVFIFH
jgi:tetratricopeptide (TPR) repeat protein